MPTATLRPPPVTVPAPPAPTRPPVWRRWAPAPTRPVPLGRDALWYALAALFAAGVARLAELPSHRHWAAFAVAGYLAGAATSGLLAPLLGRRPGAARAARAAVLAAVLVMVVLVPLLAMVVARVGTPAGPSTEYAQEEVAVIEAAGRLLAHSGSPYLEPGQLGASYIDYVPYLPAMALFGLPAALLGASPLADARLWFLLATLACLVAAAKVARLDLDRAVTGAQLLLALPWAALAAATGGDDLPVLGLCVLAVALAQRRRWAAAGLAAGAAAALKLFAWPLLLVLAVMVASGRGRAALARFAGAAAAVVAALVGPVLVTHPGALLVNTVAYPFGLTPAHSPAASPLPGWLLAHALPGGRLVALALLAAVAAGLGLHVCLRPPGSPARAAGTVALGLAAAMLLAPATRYGYALYPIALWTAARLLPARHLAMAA